MEASSVASAIFEFLADPVRTSLELPNMSSAQRKSIKKLVQQHDLSCESYGFGAERQLYLFKKLGAASNNKGNLDRSRSASPDGSTAAPSEESNEHELASQVIQVRNTFVHYEDAPGDERAVQSMPHNMFRKCILAEESQKAAIPKTKEASKAEVESPETIQAATMPATLQSPLSQGALVVVDGLVKLPAFNGCSAIVQGWDESVGRYDILVASSAGGCQHAKIKHENLTLVLPCP